MNQFLQNFLRDASNKLAAIRRDLQTLQETQDEISSRQVLRVVFQQIHTLKGSAAAFDLEIVRKLAHELENLLDRLRLGEIVCDRRALDALQNGIDKIEIALKNVDQGGENNLSDNLIKQICGLTASKKELPALEAILPAEFLEKLNAQEKRHLQQSRAGGTNVFVISVNFAFAEFQTKLQSLHSELSKIGEIAATLPGAFSSPTEIALQIVFAGNLEMPDLTAILENFNAEILFFNEATVSVSETVATAFLAGRKAAKELAKEIEFEIAGGELKITRKQANALSTAILHLVTNAVAHGVEEPPARLEKGKPQTGNVRVSAEEKSDLICISVSDDGRGIDFEKVAKKALGIEIEKLNSLNLQNLIFTPGFSTSEKLTEIAGRGVGLDAVKNAIEEIGGTIQIKTEIGKGTTFEIIIPRS